jgi:diguanylate cyclase
MNTHPSLHELHTFPNFESAAGAVLEYLHERLGIDLWMVTRTEGAQSIVLDVCDQIYGVRVGQVFRWKDTFCKRMVDEDAPRAAPCVEVVPAYAAAAIGKQLQVGAYVGAPLVRGDGSLFGTLCGMNRTAKGAELERELPLVELLAQLLSTLLSTELQAIEQTRRAERAENELLTDALTELYNRRGWDFLLAAEESRCRRYGSPACVLAIDLDELKQVNDTRGHADGDDLLRLTAKALRATVREQDLVARVGGDEFAVLAVECDQAGGEALVDRLIEAFAEAGVRASVGMSTRDPARGLERAWVDADRAMYAVKGAR